MFVIPRGNLVPTSSHSSISHPSSPWELLAPTLSWIFHIVRDHQCLASFTWHDAVEAHPTLSLVSIFNFFPWLRNISLSGYTVFYLSMVVVQYIKSCLTLCNPMDCSTLGFPVLHCLQSLPKLMSIESVMLLTISFRVYKAHMSYVYS